MHLFVQATDNITYKAPHSAWSVFFWALGLLLVVAIVYVAATIANQAEDRREGRASRRRGPDGGSPGS